MRKVQTVLLAAAGMYLLAGCGLKKEEIWVPDRTAVQIHEDGTITETVRDQLDRDWYDAGELSAMITESVADFSSRNPEKSLVVTSLSTENGQVDLVLDYGDYEAFADYNQVPFFCGSVLDAEMAGFRFDTEFRAVSEGELLPELMSSREPMSHKECHVLIMDSSHAAEVPKRVRYVSSNASLIGSRIVAPGYTAQETAQTEEAGGAPPADAAATAAADAREDLIYILYDF